MDEADDTGLEEAPSSGGTPKLLLILLAVNVVLTGLTAVKAMTAAPAPAAAPVEVREKSDEPGPTLELDQPFVVNLNEPSGGRYLKVGFTVEFTEKRAIGEFKKAERIIRDDILRYLSGLSVADTMGEQAKQAIQGEIVARADARLGGNNRVTRVFFSEFVIQ